MRKGWWHLALFNKKNASTKSVDAISQPKPSGRSKATSEAMAKLKAKQAERNNINSAESRPVYRPKPQSLDELDAELGAEVSRDASELDADPGLYTHGGRNKRPATRQELKMRAAARRKEDASRKNEVLNKQRVQQGKSQKLDPALVQKPSIWEKLAETKLYDRLTEMGDSKKAIDKFQRKRMFLSLIVMLVSGLIFGLLISPWLFLIGPIVGFAIYKMQLRNVESFYRGWKFQRQLNFSKFTRLVIPYLKASGGATSLYTIFNKILQRTEDETDRRNLYQLMGEMGDKPQDIQPFLDYAERSSGTDMSHLFMSTIFDFQQSTFDVSVIDELGKMASEDMMNAVDEIITMKLKRFNMFPTKVVMSSFILVAGLAIGILLFNFKDLGFGGDGGMGIQPAGPGEATPIEEYSEPEASTESDADPATPVIDEETSGTEDVPVEDVNTVGDSIESSDGDGSITTTDGAIIELADGDSGAEYESCDDLNKVFEHGVDYTHKNYALEMDRNQDGVACEA